jgi:hypothetical protein
LRGGAEVKLNIETSVGGAAYVEVQEEVPAPVVEVPVLGLNPIVTLEKRLMKMIENLV